MAEASGLDLVPDPGGAAFYGPKISVQVKDALGRNWQMSTIQLDFNMPDRFELEYTAADGTRQRPVLIHRALFGSIERFFGVLTEHYAGAFPAWLAPVQAVGVPVADAHVPYLEDVAAQLRIRGVRIEVDRSDDRMAKKIVNHTNQRVPFMLLAGDKDVEAGAVVLPVRGPQPGQRGAAGGGRRRHRGLDRPPGEHDSHRGTVRGRYRGGRSLTT